MRELREYTIQFEGLKLGKHQFEYSIDDKFFETFNFDEFISAAVEVVLDFEKKGNLFNLLFTMKGNVEVPCDVSNEYYQQEISTELPLIVKFGIEYNDDNEEILILPHEAYELNVAQYIYEAIILAVPSKRIHPKVLDGSLESETLKKLEELSIEQKEEKSTEDTDPRWDKLKDLLID
ncbi:MAG: hypothetical protein CMB99_08780 [Flavobacteriaceae bacterium]|nr:hypothetical protein [Flavobacteriaceae bacterium]|tara:strand:+ start:584025 stop:584558 length:534 start_codon:yes stop_codon:yes gene_type:complete